MTEWNYGNREWRERTGDPEWLMREALRRAVELRDKTEGERLGARPVMLVDVLNALNVALGYKTYGDDLWSDIG